MLRSLLANLGAKQQLAPQFTSQFTHSGEMIVVMFCREKEQVNQTHLGVESGMYRHAGKYRGVETLESFDYFIALAAKRLQDRLYRHLIVVGLVGLAIRHVRRVQYGNIRQVLVDSLLHQTFEVE